MAHAKDVVHIQGLCLMAHVKQISVMVDKFKRSMGLVRLVQNLQGSNNKLAIIHRANNTAEKTNAHIGKCCYRMDPAGSARRSVGSQPMGRCAFMIDVVKGKSSCPMAAVRTVTLMKEPSMVAPNVDKKAAHRYKYLWQMEGARTAPFTQKLIQTGNNASIQLVLRGTG